MHVSLRDLGLLVVRCQPMQLRPDADLFSVQLVFKRHHEEAMFVDELANVLRFACIFFKRHIPLTLQNLHHLLLSANFLLQLVHFFTQFTTLLCDL